MNPFQTRLIDAAAHGALILTSNKRLARHLSVAFDSVMQQQGHSVWPTPQIISLDGWLSCCLAEMDESWRLLDRFPAQRLWEQLIEEDSAESELELLQLSSTADKAQEAHQLLTEYQCQLDGLSLTDDQQAFLRWQRKYQDICRQQQWIDRSEIPTYVYYAITEGQIRLPRQILLAGFDQWSPTLQGLQDVADGQGAQVLKVQPEPLAAAQIHRHSCNDSRQEVEQAARWARNLLEQGVESIGVVVPDLSQRRSQIERIFRAQIDPAASIALSAEESAFSLSLGSLLKETGPIHAALEILSAGFRMTTDQASFLLRTPYLGGSLSESDKRAKLDVWIRSFRQQS
ncbi:MAG TPA: hypothetical protein VJ974_00500, partial [Geopsychrobacteraceae bacterium]|nr:hypothetical protein [Geopsychrobacteraceae bacterium]